MATRKTGKATKAAKAGAAGGGSGRKTAARQRDIQEEALRSARQAKKKAPAKKSPAQAGARRQPTTLPAQHLPKPGVEGDLDLQPRFKAPDYAGSGKLDGMAAIVTGGDSGIGRAVAVLFAREGADVAVLHLAEDGDAEETRRHVEAEGARCLVIAGDVRDPAFCEDAVGQVVDAFGRLDVLVNNAAFQQHVERLEDLTDEHLQETLQTNIAGYFHMARAALPHMDEGASIINTGSETGIFGSPKLLDYSATKGAIHAFTKALASNLLGRGHPRELRGTGAGMDAAQSGRQAGRRGGEVRQGQRHGTSRAAGGAVAGLCLPRLAGDVVVRERRDSARDGRATRMSGTMPKPGGAR